MKLFLRHSPAVLFSALCLFLPGCQNAARSRAAPLPAARPAVPFNAPDPDAPARAFDVLAALPEEQFDIAEAWVALASEEGQPESAGAHKNGVGRAHVLRTLDEWAIRAGQLLPDKPDGVDAFDALYEIVLDRRPAEMFSGDRAEHYDPAFALQKRKGTCLSMGLLALAVARRMNLPVHGVHAPSHFFLRHDSAGGTITMDVTRPQPERWSAQDNAYYRRWQRIDRGAEANGVYLRPLSDRECISVFLASRAGFHARQKAFDLARRDAERALALYPGNVTALINAGFAEEGRGDSAAAAGHYRRAIAADPGAVRAMNNLAYLQIHDPRDPLYDPAAADELIRRALRIQPDRAFLHATRGEVLAARKDWRAATAALQKALKLDPKNAAYRERFMELRAHLRGE